MTNRLKIHMIRTRAIANFGRGPDKQKRKKKGFVGSVLKGAAIGAALPVAATLAATAPYAVLNLRRYGIKNIAGGLMNATRANLDGVPYSALSGAAAGAGIYGARKLYGAIKPEEKPDNSLRGKAKRKYKGVMEGLSS